MSGSFFDAKSVANVEPSHWYWTGWTLMFGCAFSNTLICASNWAIASLVLPGITEATLIVTCLLDAAGSDAAPTASSTVVIAPNAIIALDMDFIVLPFLWSTTETTECLGVPSENPASASSRGRVVLLEPPNHRLPAPFIGGTGWQMQQIYARV